MKVDRLTVIACLFLGLFVGYFLADDSDKVKKLEAELNQVKSAAADPGKLNKVAWRSPPSFPQGRSSPEVNSPLPQEADLDELRPPKDHQERLDQWVAQMAQERDAEYTKLFSDLGLAPEAVERFKQKMTTIHKAANAAGWPLTKLAEKKNDYDEELRTMLGEEKYAQYRDTEEGKRAKREYELIQASAKTPLEAAQVDKMMEIIRAAGAYTTIRWDGPYDPLPSPSEGRAQGIEYLRELIANKTLRANRVLEAAQQSELPEAFIEQLHSYYAKDVEALEHRLNRFERKRPIEEHKQEVIAEMIESQMKTLEAATKRKLQ